MGEIELVIAKLKEMGLGEDDIEQLYRMALLIHKFIKQVPNINSRLELDGDEDLLDNVLLYLLGLENKMGPLGFIALHHVLPELMTRSDGDGEIVDVVIEPLEESAGRQALQSQELRSRRQTEEVSLDDFSQFEGVPWLPYLPLPVVDAFY